MTMRVRSVEAIPVAYPEPNDAGATRHVCLVKVRTDDDVVGWGESITQWPEASRATREIVDGLAPLVIGRPVTELAAIWQSLIDHTWWYGWRGGIARNAIAGIDIALWDAKARTLGCSVLDLLGGPVHDRLPAIASCHAFQADLDQVLSGFADWVGSGLQGVKVGFGKRGESRLGYEHDRDVAFVRDARAAIGPDASLMVDLGVAVYWDAATAIRRVNAFAEHDLAWIEEPLGPWDPAGYLRLRGAIDTAIAWGEREWDLRGYTEVLETGCVDVIGVDPGRVGGISGFVQIDQAVRSHRRQINAHAWSGAIVSAASLALSFASPAAKLFELKPLRNPMQHDLVTEPIDHDQGWLHPLPGPGLGIEVQDDVVDHYRLT